MRTRIVLAALTLFLLPAAAHADTLTFANPDYTFTFSAQAGQQIEARITQYTCTGFDKLTGINCGDANTRSLWVYNPAGAIVASQWVPLNMVTSLDIIFTAATTGQYTVAFGEDSSGPGGRLRGATWNGQVTISDPVPEPATLLLLGTGLAGVGTAVRRRRSEKTARG